MLPCRRDGYRSRADPLSDLVSILMIDGSILMPVTYYGHITSDTVQRIETFPIVVAKPDHPLRRPLARSAL